MNKSTGTRIMRAIVAFVLGITGVVAVTASPVAAALEGTLSITVAPASANEATSRVITITATPPPDVPFTVTIDTTDIEATTGDDYTAPATGPHTIPTSGSVDVPLTITDDALDEPSETFTVDISTSSNPGFPVPTDGTESALVTIVDNDPTPTVQLDATTFDLPEGTEDPTATDDHTIGLTLSAASGRTVSVAYTLADGTATTDDDYADGATAGTVTFAPGTTAASIAVTTTTDAFDENDETFGVTLSNPTNATLGANTAATVTITDDDDPPAASIDNVTVAEEAGSLDFTVTLDVPSNLEVQVLAATSDGDSGCCGAASATAGSDYTTTSQTLTFAPGEVTKTLSVPVLNDELSEVSPEALSVTLTELANVTVGDADTPHGLGSITDTDGVPVVSVDSISILEGDAGTTTGDLTLSLNKASGQSIDVTLTLSDGSATGGTDYVADPPTTVTFAPGELTKTVTVTVNGDVLSEVDETITATLTSTDAPALVTLDVPGTVTITDDDPLVTVSIDDASDTESAGQLDFTVSLSAASGQDVMVQAATSDGTALAGSDYTAKTETITVPAGSTTAPFFVLITDDAFAEADENFTVTLSGETGAALGDDSGNGTILNDDGSAPTISVDDVTVDEDAGTATLTATLSATFSSDVLFDVDTRDDTATGGDDYAVTNLTDVTIPANTLSTTFTVPITDDTTQEPDTETFFVDLSNLRNALPAGSDLEGVVTINDNDDDPVISMPTIAAPEGDFALLTGLNATLSHASTKEITVSVAITGGTATAGDDFTAVTPQTLTFAPGETSQALSYTILGDTIFEDDETIVFTPSGATNATTDGPGSDTFLNDDPTPEISIDDVTIDPEADGTATFTVTLSNVAGHEITVQAATADGTTPDEAAVAPGDYTAVLASTVTFPAGQTSATFTVPVKDDTLDENDESFTVELSTPTGGATIADGTGVATIVDNDDPATANIDNQTYNPEKNATESTIQNFTITLDKAVGKTVGVSVTTQDGTAIAASGDYTPHAEMFVFAPGETTKSFPVTVLGDDLTELNETFNVIFDGTNGVTAGTPGIGSIIDDDSANVPKVSITPTTISQDEGDAGTSPVTLTVQLDQPTGQPVTVKYSTAAGTATADGDYVSKIDTATIATGTTSVDITVDLKGDADEEADETFTVTLSEPSGATLGTDTTSTVTITNDDPPPTVSIKNAAAIEGNSGTTVRNVKVELSGTALNTVTVNYVVGDGSAVTPADYTAANGTLTFAPGETVKTFPVTIAGDIIDEGTGEIINTTLASATGAAIDKGTGVVVIIDDDAKPELSVDDVAIAEGDSGTTTATFTVSITNPSSTNVTVNVDTANDTATAGSDYTAIATQTLVFTPTGALTQTVSITVTGDTTEEVTEKFNVVLSGVSANATIKKGTGIGTITDDDGPDISISDNLTITEGDSGTSNATFPVALSAASAVPISVDFTTVGGTATAGSDFVAQTGTVTFAAGATTATVTIVINGDTVGESNESFTVVLSNNTAGTITDDTATGTIIDDDNAPVVSINNVTRTEGNAGTTAAVFTVSLSKASTSATSVTVTSANGTATAGVDYQAVAPTIINFAAGETSKTVSVNIIGDTVDESDETFTMTLSAPVGIVIGSGVGTGTITDDDSPPNRWFIRNTATTGNHDASFNFGQPGDIALACDWDGNGTDTPGVFRNGTWLLNNGLDGIAEETFVYGQAGDTPFCGDWNKDGTDTVGVHRGQTFMLRNSNSAGAPDLSVAYGREGDLPVVGDWNGDDRDTLGVFRGNITYLRNSNSGGPADLSFSYGKLEDVKVVGDWNGNGTDTFAIRRGNVYFVRNSNSSGTADFSFGYGNETDKPVAGNWSGTGTSGIGIIRNG